MIHAARHNILLTFGFPILFLLLFTYPIENYEHKTPHAHQRSTNRTLQEMRRTGTLTGTSLNTDRWFSFCATDGNKYNKPLTGWVQCIRTLSVRISELSSPLYMPGITIQYAVSIHNDLYGHASTIIIACGATETCIFIRTLGWVSVWNTSIFASHDADISPN